MSKYKVILYNQSTYEIEDDFVDGMIFNSEEEAQNYIDEIHDSMPAGEDELRLSGRYDESTDYGYGYKNDDLVLQVEEMDQFIFVPFDFDIS